LEVATEFKRALKFFHREMSTTATAVKEAELTKGYGNSL